MTEKADLSKYPPVTGLHSSVFVPTEFLNKCCLEVDKLLIGKMSKTREANPLELLAMEVLEKNGLLSIAQPDIEAHKGE